MHQFHKTIKGQARNEYVEGSMFRLLHRWEKTEDLTKSVGGGWKNGHTLKGKTACQQVSTH